MKFSQQTELPPSFTAARVEFSGNRGHEAGFDRLKEAALSRLTNAVAKTISITYDRLRHCLVFETQNGAEQAQTELDRAAINAWFYAFDADSFTIFASTDEVTEEYRGAQNDQYLMGLDVPDDFSLVVIRLIPYEETHHPTVYKIAGITPDKNTKRLWGPYGGRLAVQEALTLYGLVLESPPNLWGEAVAWSGDAEHDARNLDADMKQKEAGPAPSEQPDTIILRRTEFFRDRKNQSKPFYAWVANLRKTGHPVTLK